MDRRRERRVNVNMNATIINSGAHPIGCRVGNVSNSGIMLKQNNDGPNLPVEDEVEVRLSLKQDDSRKVINLPVKIVREGRNQVGGTFTKAQPQLLRLVKPNEEAHLNDIHDKRTEQLKTQSGFAPNTSQADETSKPQFAANQVASWVAILLLFAFAGFLHLDNQQLRDTLKLTETQLAALENQPARALKENTPATPNAILINELALLRTQITELSERTRELESRPTGSAPETKASRDTSLPIPVRDNWVVNLLSLANQRAALDFARSLQTQGINAEVNEESGSQGSLWRVQVSGFESRQAAVDFSEQTRAVLDLNGVWIYKESN